jgi:hypothetical protein
MSTPNFTGGPGRHSAERVDVHQVGATRKRSFGVEALYIWNGFVAGADRLDLEQNARRLFLVRFFWTVAAEPCGACGAA